MTPIGARMGEQGQVYLLLHKLHLLKRAAATVGHAGPPLGMLKIKREHAIVWCCSSLTFRINAAGSTITHRILTLCT